MEKNKLILNEYLGIFMHFRVHIFLNLENGIFQTYQPTKSGKFPILFFLTIPRSCKRRETLFKSLLFWLAGEMSWLAVEVRSPCQK